MIKQYRYPIKSVSFDLPVGNVWANLTSESCVKREFKEEMGFTVGKFEKILFYHPSTEYSNQISYFYYKGLKKGKTNIEKHEIINVELLDVRLVIEKIIDETITYVHTINTVLFYKIYE